MIEITVNDRLGKKVRVKCNEGKSLDISTFSCRFIHFDPLTVSRVPNDHIDDTIGDLKKLIAAQVGT